MQTDDLSVEVSATEHEARLTVAGEIDMSTVNHLSAAVEHEIEKRPDRVVLDLSGVRLCDSMGLGTLVLLNRSAQRARSRLILRNPSPVLRRLLDVTGLVTTFDIEEA